MPITVVNFRQNSKLMIFYFSIRKVFNFQCYNLSFLGGYIPPESSTKLNGISGRNDNMYEPVIGLIHPFSVEDWSHPFHHCEPVALIDVNQSHRPLRTLLRQNGVHQPWFRTSASVRDLDFNINFQKKNIALDKHLNFHNLLTKLIYLENWMNDGPWRLIMACVFSPVCTWRGTIHVTRCSATQYYFRARTNFLHADSNVF